jgi:hypothetical protein
VSLAVDERLKEYGDQIKHSKSQSQSQTRLLTSSAANEPTMARPNLCADAEAVPITIDAVHTSAFSAFPL